MVILSICLCLAHVIGVASTPVNTVKMEADLLGAEAYTTSWWMLWHQHYTELKRVKEVMGLTHLQEEATAPPSDAAAQEQQVQRMQLLNDEMKEKLQNYWEFLSNSTLNHQPYPRVKNAELHSDGVINNVITASIEWDHPEDEDKLVSKYWFRFSSDCTDMGRLEPTMPPVLVLQVDPLIQRYRVLLGPVRVPEGSRCLLIYSADKNSQPFPQPVALLLPQFRYPKPDVLIAGNCKMGWDGCFETNSTGTSCESLMGKGCCALPMCIGCRECSQIRNIEPIQIRPRLYSVEPTCTNRWERQGFAAIYHFNCDQAIAWGLMTCEGDRLAGFCRRTCSLCDPRTYVKGDYTGPKNEKSPALPDGRQ
eukprot:c11758_g1_i1.p1 GENE.c11758_g1_i1~~c11758_g1_i1.p1  ORF type:complete len:364 (-),score=81.28 c11758_g1_i1:39-1130(-)